MQLIYKLHSNLKEKFQGNLTRKLQKDLISVDFAPGTCFCNGPTKTPDEKWRYGDNCNTSIVVYEVTCKYLQLKYIGGTQDTFKAEMKGNYSDFKWWFKEGERTDSFAQHFVRHFKTQSTAVKIREMCKFRIIRTINPFSFTRGIQTL